MNIYFAYLAVVLAYLPGLWAIARWKPLAATPLLTFGFLGLFFFNAVGSIVVMQQLIPTFMMPESRIPEVPLFSADFVGMLIAQAMIYYAVFGAYLYLCARRRIRSPAIAMTLTPADDAVRRLGLIVVGAMLILFAASGGRFIVLDLIAGRLNYTNVLEYRSHTYGHPWFWVFRLGFLVLPMLIVGITVLRCSLRHRIGKSDVAYLIACCVPQLLLGEKSAVMYLVAAFIMAYTLHLAVRGLTIRSMFSPRFITVVLGAAIPTLVTYHVYYRNAEHTPEKIMRLLAFRMVGVYSESLAAVVPMKEFAGELRGRTLPTIHGLLPHARFDVETSMHSFIWRGNFDDTATPIQGSASVAAAGEGYLNFGRAGFALFAMLSAMSIVAFQELLLRLRLGVTGGALQVWYAWLAAMTATTSLFATLISLVHTLFFIAVVVAWKLLSVRRAQAEVPTATPLRRAA